MDRIIAIILVLFVMVLGFLINFISIERIDKKRNELIEYLNKFIKLMQGIRQSKPMDKELYFWLSERSKGVQQELAEHGIIAKFKEPITGKVVKNYHLITDFVPNMSSAVAKKEKYIHFAEFYNMAKVFEEAFLKHKRILDRREEYMKKSFINPIALFTYGIIYIIQSPLNFLSALKIVSAARVSKIKKNMITRIFNFIIVSFCFISALLIIMLGTEKLINIFSIILA